MKEIVMIKARSAKIKLHRIQTRGGCVWNKKYHLIIFTARRPISIVFTEYQRLCFRTIILRIEGVKFSVSMGKIFFDKNKICIIVLSKFLVFCCRIIYLIIVLPIRLRLYLNFKIFCSTNNGISNPFSWALPTPGLGNKLGFSGNTINAEGIR